MDEPGHSRAVLFKKKKDKKKLTCEAEATPSAGAALYSGCERECEQGVRVTSWHQYKCSLNPCLSFVMTTDSARCSSLL